VGRVWSPVDVVNGQGVIEVAGDAGAAILLFAGTAVAVGGDDGSGSVGRLAGRVNPATANPAAPTASEVKDVTEWLADPDLRPSHRGRQVHPPDSRRLRPLLDLLRPGRYVMTAFLARRPLLVDGSAHWYEDRELVLVPTDHWPPRDAATVREYRDRIERDLALPAVVALSSDPASEIGFVLDGHHKLAAYRQAARDPLVIQLAPERPCRPRLDDLRRAGEVFAAEVAAPLDSLRQQALQVGCWADWLAERGNYPEAEAEYRTDLANLRRMIAKRSRGGDDTRGLRLRLAEAHHKYGVLLLTTGRDGGDELRSALAIRTRLLDRDHPETQETRRVLESR
jgi:hypothetical protein